jgi:hypothetical protein
MGAHLGNACQTFEFSSHHPRTKGVRIEHVMHVWRVILNVTTKDRLRLAAVEVDVADAGIFPKKARKSLGSSCEIAASDLTQA